MNLVLTWGMTKRERQALELICELGCAKAVARKMGMSPRTVEFWLRKVREKAGVSHTIQAAIEWDRFRRVRG